MDTQTPQINSSRVVLSLAFPPFFQSIRDGDTNRKGAMESRITTGFTSINFDQVAGSGTEHGQLGSDTCDRAPPCGAQLVATTRAPDLAGASLRGRTIAS